MPDDVAAKDWTCLPTGEYAIVELFGHTTLIGRIAEVERFGAKMLAIECLFKNEMLLPVFHGGSAIYRLTPCTREVAWQRQPQADYHLPPSIRATVPAPLLAAPNGDDRPYVSADTYDDDQDHNHYGDDDV